jgi:hypothetical protein
MIPNIIGRRKIRGTPIKQTSLPININILYLKIKFFLAETSTAGEVIIGNLTS